MNDRVPNRAAIGRLVCAGVVISLLLFAPGINRAQADDEGATSESATALWRSHIQPLLMDRCQKCHGGAKAEAGLDLRTVESILAGSDDGPVVVGGAPEESRLAQVIRPTADSIMPPESKGLSEDERGLIERWIVLLDQTEGVPADLETSGGETQALKLPPASMEPTQVIDYLLAEAWAEAGVNAAPRCDDATFARRVYLDTVGRIPRPDELNEFLSRQDSDKRNQLIDELLASEEFAQHYAILFDAVLMGRKGEGKWRQRVNVGWHDFLKRRIHEDRPWNETLATILLARPETVEDKPATWYLYERNNNYQEIAEAISPAVFGVQIQCAQCHDHPLAPEIKQAHYWGLVAFFARGKNKETPQGLRIEESAIGAYDKFTNISGESFPNLLTFMDREPIEEARPENPEKESDEATLYREPGAVNGKSEGLPRVPLFSRREKFVEHVLTDHPRVATAMTNRLWAIVMGRGLVHPVDKIDSVHPSAHPELFAWLARDFEQHDYRIRRTLRAILRSQAYQLSIQRHAATTSPELFSYAIEKPLTGEVLARSLRVGLWRDDPANVDLLRQGLVKAFPDVLPEESITTLKQTLYLSNNAEFNSFFSESDGSLIQEMVAADDTNAVELMFQRLLNRSPTSDEAGYCGAYLATKSDRPSDAIRHLVWALATSAEFRFNH